MNKNKLLGAFFFSRSLQEFENLTFPSELEVTALDIKRYFLKTGKFRNLK